jgi:hypothetical protein
MPNLSSLEHAWHLCYNGFVPKIISKRNISIVGCFFSFLLLVNVSLVNNAFATYNASYIMPDSVFVNSGSMTEQQIQSFLVSQGSYLANYTIPAAHNETYDFNGDGNLETYWAGTEIGPVGHEVDSTGWTASHLIYEVSQWYGINPQVILVTLEKEQSLITMSGYETYGNDWAMGYAYTDSGIVAACGTSTNNNPTGSCAGLAMQIDWGAGSLMFNYNGSADKNPSVSPYWEGNTITIDGSSIYIGNNSTASLYRYTPHNTYGGNFRTYFNDWFTNIDYTNIVPVYRFYDVQNGSHFYTASESEKNNIIATWPNVY